MKLPISAIILSYNEELNIEKCLKSIADLVSEILVVDGGPDDSYSTDKTLEIAKKYGAKTFSNSFENQAQQFNWALDNLPVENEWVLRLDCDEYLTGELRREITEILPKTPAEVSGFYAKRRVYFMGKWIKHGGYYPTWILRLFRYGKARSELRKMDEHIVLSEGKSAKLKSDFVDDDRRGLKSWINKHNEYSTREANERTENAGSPEDSTLKGQAKKKRWLKKNFYYRLPLFCRAFLYFIYRYFIRLGFLDGKEGLIFHFLQACWHQFLIDAKIYEQRKKKADK